MRISRAEDPLDAISVGAAVEVRVLTSRDYFPRAFAMLCSASQVRVISVDIPRARLALSMRDPAESGAASSSGSAAAASAPATGHAPGLSRAREERACDGGAQGKKRRRSSTGGASGAGCARAPDGRGGVNKGEKKQKHGGRVVTITR